MNNTYNTLIIGSGPIAASTAYFLTQSGAARIGMVTQDPTESIDATYLYAGGSMRWFWPDALKTEMTKQTAEFIAGLDTQGVDLSLVKNGYLFLQRGKFVPSYNISSKKLVTWFLEQSKSKGLAVHESEVVTAVTKHGDLWNVVTNKNEYKAEKVLLAMGAKNVAFAPGYELETEKRQLFVLDLPVGENEEHIPHTIVPINDGVVYVFIKKFPEGMRFVVGQEDVIDGDSEEEPNEQFQQLLTAGLGAIMPFLKDAKVEKHLWAFDVANKTLKLEEPESGLFVANCGSAIRACAWIGTEVAKKLQG